MGILNVKALRDWILLRGVNHMLATEKGFFMDARLGPVIQGELDKLKADVGEINSNLKDLKVLFSGTIGTPQTITLLDKIDNFMCLVVVFGSGGLSVNNDWTQQIIINPKFIHGNLTTNINTVTAKTGYMKFHFENSTTMVIDALSTGNSEPFRAIYGLIKKGYDI